MEYTNTKNGNDIGIDISAKFVEWCKKWGNDYHGHFAITLTTKDGSESFDFYGSVYDASHNKTALTEDDLKHALECILSDALAGIDSFEEFCGNFGYDEDSRSAERIHNACKETTTKINALGISEDEIYSILNDLNGDN